MRIIIDDVCKYSQTRCEGGDDLFEVLIIYCVINIIGHKRALKLLFFKSLKLLLQKI